MTALRDNPLMYQSVVWESRLPVLSLHRQFKGMKLIDETNLINSVSPVRNSLRNSQIVGQKC